MATTTAEFIYDPSTAQFQEELWDVYRVLRNEHPVYRHPVTGTYALSRFDDVWRAVHDNDTFSSVVAEAVTPDQVNTTTRSSPHSSLIATTRLPSASHCPWR